MYDVIIIGSGCAGYTAGIYTSRAFLKTLLLTGSQLGGQLTTTTDVENFPGFPHGIQGPALLQNMKEQAERFGVEMQMETVKAVTKNGNTFQVTTEEQTYESRAVIITTGASAKSLGIPSEAQFRGKGISYCATCDGFFFRGKTIAVFGGGDTAMEEATFLTKFAEKVYIVHRRGELRASKIMIKKAKSNPKITFLLDKTVKTFTGETVLQGVTIVDNQTGKEETVAINGAFVAIGHTPATAFLNNVIAMDEKGYIKTDKTVRSTLLKDSETATSIDGIFAAGDCVDSRYRQGIVAAGMGAMAALDTEHYLEK